VHNYTIPFSTKVTNRQCGGEKLDK